MKNLMRFPGIVALAAVIGLGVSACDFLLGNENNNNSSTGYGWYGNGSASNFTIGNAAQLAEFAKIVNGTTGKDGPAQSDFRGKTVTLSANINLTSQWEPVGAPYIFKQGFAGTFDGSGKTIYGLFCSGGNHNRGLFGAVSEGGIVKNLVLADISINAGELTGGLVGVNNGTVQNCNVTGNINGSSSCGGVVGSNYGIVQNCSFSGSVIGWSVGGIVGENQDIVQYCYAAGSVNSDSSNCGGVVGGNSGTVRNCYATNNVSGGTQSDVGGVVGHNYSSSLVQNCYTTGSVTSSKSYGGGLGGVVGLNSSGTVQNCAALNPSLSRPNSSDTSTSRVTNNSYGSLSNNYGLSGMTLPSGITVTSNANGEHGADVSASNYNSQAWWTTASNWNSASLWDFNTVWEWDSARNLPKLRMQ